MKTIFIMLFGSVYAYGGNPTIIGDYANEEGQGGQQTTLKFDASALSGLGFWSVDGVYAKQQLVISEVPQMIGVTRLFDPTSQSSVKFQSAFPSNPIAIYKVKITSEKEYFYHVSTGAVVSIEFDYTSDYYMTDGEENVGLEVSLWNSTYEFSIPANLTVSQLYHPEDYEELEQWAWLINHLWGDYYGDIHD